MVSIAFLERDDIRSIASTIAGELVQVRAGANSVRLTTPVLFPSGAHVSLMIHGGPSRYVVTDDGSASIEAETMGMSRAFLRIARDVAESSGVRFNDHEFFEADAALDRLPGIVAIVADAARMAVERTAAAMAERIEGETKQNLADRLVTIFGKNVVTESAKIAGASQHTWKFDASVASDDRVVLFSVTSPSPNSVASTFIKMDDVRRLEPSPRTVAVLTNRDAFKPDQITILNRAAKLISADSPDADFIRLVA